MSKNELEKFDIFVDFGNGDKFMVKAEEVDVEKKRIVLKGSQGQMRWVKIDALNPVKLTNDGTRNSKS